MAPTVRKSAPAAAGPSFLDLSFYSGGFLLPPGKYAMEHNIVLHSFTDKNGNTKGDPRLGVMLTAHPLEGEGQPIEQFISMGTKAHLSFVPNDTGKGLEAVAGGPGSVSNKANWFYYLESLMNSGLPADVAKSMGNDISGLDGIWVQTDNIPEPEDRKGFASTSEVEQTNSGPRKMPVVVEILDGGKPWEGSGGIPDGTQPVKAAAPKVGPKPVVKGKPAPVAVEASVDGDAVRTAATNGIASVLSKPQNAKGMVKLMLKTGTFKAVTDAESNEMAQAVTNEFFGSDESNLASLLDELDFKINGTRIEPK